MSLRLLESAVRRNRWQSPMPREELLDRKRLHHVRKFGTLELQQQICKLLVGKNWYNTHDGQHATTVRRRFCHKSWLACAGCTASGPLLCTGSPLHPPSRYGFNSKTSRPCQCALSTGDLAATGPTRPTQGAVVPWSKKTSLWVDISITAGNLRLST